MRRARSRLKLAALALVLAGGAPRLASGEAPKTPEARATEQFRAGVKRYEEGDLQGAAAAFALAYELSHDFRLLYNLAQVQEDLQDHARALRSLELYLARGGAQIAAERREEVARTQADLARRSASVRVTTNVEVPLPEVPPVVVPPPVEVPPVVERHAARGASDAPRPGEARERVPLWIGMGAAGASAALAVGFALLTRNADAQLDRELSHYPADAEAIDAARSRVATLAAVTDVCIGTSVVAASVSLFFALSSRERDDTPLGNLRLEIAPGSSSVGIESTF